MWQCCHGIVSCWGCHAGESVKRQIQTKEGTPVGLCVRHMIAVKS